MGGATSQHSDCLAEAVTGGICPDPITAPLASLEFHVRAWQQLFNVGAQFSTVVGLFSLLLLWCLNLLSLVKSSDDESILRSNHWQLYFTQTLPVLAQQWHAWWAIHEHSPTR